jgi:hypothetical protein
MAHQDPVDPLSEFDTLLRQELSVEPSNIFLPRVREQIRTEPAGAPWMRLWRFVPLAAAAALVLAIGVFMLSRATGPNPEPSPIASAPAPTQAPAPASPPLRDVPATNLGVRTASSGQRTTDNGQRSAKDPEVIVDARQRDALHAFVRMVNQGQLTADAFKQTKPPPLHIEEEVPIIGVVPVSVSPIVVGGVLQGESGRK